MNNTLIAFNKEQRGQKKIDFQPGDVVKISLKIKEGGKERVQMYEGLVIAIKGRQSSSPTITVRKISHGVGVEMILPVLSKNVQKIELVKRAKVRQAKLYYVRDLTAKQSRMKYKDLKEFIKEEPSQASAETPVEPKEEQPKEEKKEEPKAEKVEKKKEKKSEK